jgi:uncharacterized protein (TIGR02466 family)
MTDRTYQFIYSGPLLFKTKIDDKDLVKISKYCNKKNFNDNRANLAGIIKQEYRITHLKEISKILKPYLDMYKHAYKNWYLKEGSLEVQSCWVNYMKAGESNPMHTHINCDFSSVIYLQIPSGIKKEREQTINDGSKQGDIWFHFNAGPKGYIENYFHIPERGDFFIFPAGLYHTVNPFKCKGERISVACNFHLI